MLEYLYHLGALIFGDTTSLESARHHSTFGTHHHRCVASQRVAQAILSWVADWPQSRDFGRHLRWSGILLMLLSKSQENAPFHRTVWPGLYSFNIWYSSRIS